MSASATAALFDHVIAGYDGRDGGRDAIALAAALRPRRLTVVMAYGAESIVAPTALIEYWDLLRADAERRLAAACAKLGAGAEQLAIADASPARALQRAATEGGADLLVVGSAHRGRIGRVLSGDVGRAVLGHAPCAVAVAPKGLDGAQWTLGRVGVAFDGRADAVGALRAAVRIARSCDASLTIFTAWHEATAAADFPYALERASYEGERRARDILDAGLALAGPNADGRLLHGVTHRLLCEATEDVDLMVAGSRSWGPVRRVLLGSTSHHLVHDSHCPVLIVPRAVAADAAAPAGEQALRTARP